MSLRIGSAFLAALRANTDLQAMLGGTATEDDETTYTGARIFYVARAETDEQQDRIPYLIVMPKGITTQGNKDNYDAEEVATVDVLCVATDGESLVELAEMVKATIEDSLQGDDTYHIDDFAFSASAVQFDPDKPCFFQTLTYLCSTTIQ